MDLSELAEADIALEHECIRLGHEIKANIAAYQAGAKARPAGLCTKYRFAELGQEESAALRDAELSQNGIILVAYARPLAQW